MTALNDLIEFSPSVWPGKEEAVLQPGDLTKFLPNSHDLCDDFFEEKQDPFKRMPSSQRVGGAICFDSNAYRKDKEAFMTLMKALEMWDARAFAAFIEERWGGKTFLSRQMRIVSSFALRYAFEVIDEEEYDSFPEQKVSMTEAFWLFLQQETIGCDAPKNISPKKMATLVLIPPSIGIMAENSYHNVYRIWSRWPQILK
jgi:hypothetical protein